MSAPRIALVSTVDMLTDPLGSTAYFNQIARLLKGRGAELHMLQLRPEASEVTRIPLEKFDDLAAPYDSVALWKSLRLGGHFYRTDLRGLKVLFDRARGRPGRSQPWLSGPSAGALDWAAAQINRIRPDIVMSNYINTVGVFDRLTHPARKVLIAHDVIALRARSFEAAGVTPDFDLSLIEAEAAAFGKADLIVTIKAEEEAFVQDMGTQAATVTVPVVADMAPVDPATDRDPVALFVGGLFRANSEALAWLANEIWPEIRVALPDARLRVIGRVAETPDIPWGDGIEQVGFVDDLTAEYAAARVALGPMRIGSGIKIKMIEALAHGLPCVATPVSAEGIPESAPGVVRIADDAPAFAAATIAALSDPDGPSTRARARDFAARTFGAEEIGARLWNAVFPSPSLQQPF